MAPPLDDSVDTPERRGFNPTLEDSDEDTNSIIRHFRRRLRDW